MRKEIGIIIVCILSLLSMRLGAQTARYAAHSVLAEGKWVKVKVDQTGIYKLTHAELQAMGFSDPTKVSVHGYGGAMLAEDFSQPYTDDLPATPVWRGNDYLLFYAQGPIQWSYDRSEALFTHTRNPYATAGYYFLTDATETMEMATQPTVEGATVRLTTFDEHLLHEQELVSLSQSGRELFGEDFSGATPRAITTFSSLPGITNGDAKVTMRFVSKVSSGSGQATLSVNNSNLLSLTLPSTTSSYVAAASRIGTALWEGEKQEKNSFIVSYSSASHSNVRLDYIRLQYERTLQNSGAFTLFRSVASIGNVSRFLIEGADAQTLVFDVTDPNQVKQMETTLEGTTLSFSIAAGSLREFAVVQPNRNFTSPTVIGEVANQDLHGLEQQDMIILAPKDLTAQAERLAEAHRTQDGLTVQVVNPEAVYNEFSSGTPDATAYRRFMKMFYDRSQTQGNPPRYLLLFGDGIFDNRGLCSEVKNISLNNMLLTFQSQESLIEFSSYSYSFATDDYFGFLDDASGSNLSTDKMRIGVGRFPVRTVTEATQMVDKVIGYMNGASGSWKNNMTFVADDGSNADSYTTRHAEQAEVLAQYIEANCPAILTNKVYFDTYKRSNTGGYPDVHEKIASLLKSGQLLINYTGHGNTTSWADEHVWTQNDIEQSTYTRLPVWVTATCDFTRFDAVTTSAGESVFLNPTSGGIALFTTTRTVESSGNAALNQRLYQYLFTPKADGEYRSLGEAMMETKCALTGVNKLNFILIGDPALKMAIPDYQVKVTTINGASVENGPIKFQALQQITVAGEIRTPDAQVAADFSGQLQATVMDSQDTITTLGNNTVNGEKVYFRYPDYPNTLYIGQGTVTNGKFQFSFTVPKDISYSNRMGKMSLYALAEDNREAQGAFQNYQVGGTAEVAEQDTIGPVIRKLYLNDTTFVAGGQVNATPYFVARLWDQSGVNITGSSIGHDIMLTIDNLPSRSYNLNGYYALVSDAEGEGLVQFSIPQLSPGVHTAEFKVWDILNNSTTYTFTFEVVEGLKPNLIDLYATPNPARAQVEFSLAHDRPESNLEVTIFVYDMTGKLLWNTTKQGSSELFKAYVVTWDLCDNGGRRLRPGVYLYRAAIRCNSSKEVTKANKLIILAQ